MKKKLLSLALALAVCLNLTVPALAAGKTVYLNNQNGEFGTPLVPCSADKALFVITGDVSQTGKVKSSEAPIYTSNGPAKVDIKAYTPSYNPRNIALNSNHAPYDKTLALMSSVQAMGEDTGYACGDAVISLIALDQSDKGYQVVKEHPVCFEGQFEIYDEQNNPRIVSIKDYYTDPSVISYGMPTLASNLSVTLTEPGVYYLSLSCDGPSGDLVVEAKGDAAPSAAPKFTDVAAASPYKDAIDWAVKQSITKGITNTTFGPGNTCTVSHILTFLWRAAGQPGDSVSDWAAGKGIDAGDMNAPCTRAMAVEFIWKAAGSPAPAKTASFSDVSASAGYAKAVSWAVEKGVTNGTSATTFGPDNTCTRGQIVTFLYRASK